MTDAVDEQPAAPGSALADLRARREALLAANYKDLEIPGWDLVGPPLFARFRPVDQAVVDRITEKHAGSKADDLTVRIHAAVFVEHCVGVFQLVDGTLEKVADGFDHRLGLDIGLEEDAGAVAVVKAMFPKDGDLISTAFLLNEWSGFTTARVRREFSGN